MRLFFLFCLLLAVYSFKYKGVHLNNVIRRFSRLLDAVNEAKGECPLVVQLRQDSRNATLNKERSKAEAIQSIIAAVQKKEIDDRVPMT